MTLYRLLPAAVLALLPLTAEEPAKADSPSESILTEASDSALREVELENGSKVRGWLLKENDSALWLDLGFEVLRIPRPSAMAIRKPEQNSQQSDLPSEGLFSTRERSQSLPVERWVPRLGRGVVEIRSRAGQGSGFVINEQGMIITNYHVIAQDNLLTVTVFSSQSDSLRKIQYKDIRILAMDPSHDLALLQIADELEEPLEILPFGQATELETGEGVFAIGSPLGLDRTVSRGIVSLSERLVNGNVFLQTTAQINPGNSGGPLFNFQGEVIGVNTLKFVRTGIEGVGFAIPIETVKTFLERRNAFAFDPRNPNTGIRYLNPPSKAEWAEKSE